MRPNRTVDGGTPGRDLGDIVSDGNGAGSSGLEQGSHDLNQPVGVDIFPGGGLDLAGGHGADVSRERLWEGQPELAQLRIPQDEGKPHLLLHG